MVRAYLLTLMMYGLLATGVYAQVQVGKVKTRGRMERGVLVPGKGLSDVVLRIHGRSAIKTDRNGVFSFPLRTELFSIESVEKNGYTLVDMDVCGVHEKSSDTLYVVMEMPEQQQKDLLQAERRIRRQLQDALRQQEDSIDRLNLSITEKNEKLRLLYDEQSKNERLTHEMAQRYASIDYDQMDDINREITECIMRGELHLADSMMKSKGSIAKRTSALRQFQDINRKERTALAEREHQADKERKEIAADCKMQSDIFDLRHQTDSAAKYMQMRADLDSTNVEWQLDLALYCQNHYMYDRAVSVLQKTLDVVNDANYFRKDATSLQTLRAEKLKAQTLSELAGLLSLTGRYDDAGNYQRGAMEIRMQMLSRERNNENKLESAHEIGKHAFYLARSNKIEEAMYEYHEAMKLYDELRKDMSDKYDMDYEILLANMALTYHDIEMYDVANKYSGEALEIARRLYQKEPQQYAMNYQKILTNLSIMLRQQGNPETAETYGLQALEIQRELVKKDSARNELELLTYGLIHLSSLYVTKGEYEQADSYMTELFGIFQRWFDKHPFIYAKYSKWVKQIAKLYTEMSDECATRRNEPKGAERYCIKARDIREYAAKMSETVIPTER